jgi:hypothetical protein
MGFNLELDCSFKRISKFLKEGLSFKFKIFLHKLEVMLVMHERPIHPHQKKSCQYSWLRLVGGKSRTYPHG